MSVIFEKRVAILTEKPIVAIFAIFHHMATY